MAGTETSSIKPEPPNTPAENSNENPRERNAPGGGNRGPRGRKGGTRFSGGRGGGMGGGSGGGGGGGGRNNDAVSTQFQKIKEFQKDVEMAWERWYRPGRAISAR